jgi:hypothetical protein
MKAPNLRIRSLVLCASALVTLFALSGARAQSPSPQAAAQTPRARVTQAIDEQQLVQLRGNVHPQARPAFDKGVVDDAQPATRALILLQRSTEQEATLRQLLDDQQNKASANYHAWLTPEQFGKQFGPADSDVQAVTQWLTTHGFQNIKVGAGKTAIEFSGNVGQMRETFHTDIHKFLIRGEMRNANVSDPQIPAALAPVVAGVVGLSNFRPRAHVHRLGSFRKTKATGEVRPLFTFTGCGSGGTQPCFAVGPGDFAKIYNVPATMNGSGQTIVVVGDSNINPQDLVDYRNIFGLPPLTLAQATSNIIVNGPDPGLNGDEIEADLDTQISSAIAPNATVLLVVTEQPDSGVGAAGVDLSVLFTVNNNLAPVVSKSFGACELAEGTAGNALQNALWEQAAAQGISGMVSAGDNGSAACDPTFNDPDVAVNGLAVSGDASTPFNVAVGGTDFNQTPATEPNFWNTTNVGETSAKGYIPETTWNASCAFTGSVTACTSQIIATDSSQNPGIDVVAGAGGSSIIYKRPSWQTDAIGTFSSDGMRDLPDVSLFASNGINGSFYIICEQDANSGTGSNTSSCDLNSPFNDFQGVGGTSASSPAFAAIMALVNQQTGQRQGNPNFVLYSLASKPGASCASVVSPAGTCIFYDIPAQANSNISVACQGGTPNCSNTSQSATAFGIMTTTTGGSTPAFNTTAGYDMATGLGSVNVANLVTGWTSATFRPTTTTFSLSGGAVVSGTHGALVSVSGTVKPTTGTGTPTGFVELFNPAIVPTQIIDTFPLSNGAYTGTTNMLPGGGPYTVAARYGGDGIFAASTASTTGAVSSIAKEPSVVSVNLVVFDANNNPSFSSATALPYGSPYILLVGVTNTSGNLCVPPPFGTSVPAFGAPLPCPTGTITLSDNGSALKDFLVPNTNTPTNSAKLNNTGFAEDQPVQLPGGNHSLTASYAGDNSFASSNSAARALTITATATATAISASTSSIQPGGSVTLTALVSSNSNSAQGPTGTVQFMSGGSALSGPATCTPAGATAAAGASCTATLTTMAISFLGPSPAPRQMPRIYLGPLWISAFVLLAVFLLMLPRVPSAKRRACAYTGFLLFACAAAGIAGCGGGGGGGGGGGHVDNITATYSGDANYATSSSGVLQITVQ